MTGTPGTVQCPNGHENPAGQQYCGQCGQELSTPAPPSAPGAPAEISEAVSDTQATTAGGWWSSTRNRVLVGLGAALVVIVLVVVLLSGGGGSHTIKGTFTLLDSDTASNDCHGQGGFSDIDQGATVTVKNENGTILGSGALSAGKTDRIGFSCTYTFTVSGVGDAKFYAIEVSHRGSVSFSSDKMDSINWKPALSLS